MKRITKRIFSITLCMVLLISLLPVGVLAAKTDAMSILTEAYALAQGESLSYEATLTGKIVSIKTPYDSYWKNLTVVMEIAGFEDMPIVCYRLSGEGAERLAMGDIITVTGTITNYYGTIEFAQGCTLDAAVTGTQTLYCQSPEYWTQCYIYWWGSNVENPTWPGVAMTQDENGIWGCDLPSDASRVIFHNGYGIQSDGLYLPVYDNVMYVFEMNHWTIYGKVPVAYDYYVAGSEALCGVDWDANWYENKMSDAGNGVYSKIYVGVAAGSYELKITNGSWDQSWGAGIDSLNNYIVDVEQDNSTVTIYFDSQTKQVSSTVVPAPMPNTQTYYLVGYINGVDYGCEQDADNMGIYRFENGQLTVCFEQDSYVSLKTEGNERWLGTQYYCGLTTDTFSEEWTEWMWIPGQVEFTLTLTENPDGTVTMGYVWPSEADIIDVAYRLEESVMLEQVFTLTGTVISIDTPYSSEYDNITVTILVPGSQDQPIQCYRVSGDGAKNLTVGSQITVSGNLSNYRGKIQFTQGCTLDQVHNTDPVPIPGPQQIVDDAYELEPGMKLPYSVALTGEIIAIDAAYDPNYKNITVTMVIEGREDKPLVCYRLRGDGVENLKIGDMITVEGFIQNYAYTDPETGEILYSTIEFTGPKLVAVQPIGRATFYCNTPDNWTQCYVYSWNDEGHALSGDWPGTLMTWEYGNLWSCEVPDNAVSLLFNNGNGGANDHTGDLQIPSDNKNVYVVEAGQWKTLAFLDPDHDGWGPDSLAIVGDGIPGVPVWYPEDPAGDMDQVEDNVYTKTLVVPAGTSMVFKFAGNDCWDDNWNFGGAAIELNRLLELERGGGSEDMKLSVKKDSVLRFTVDLNNMKDGGKATLLVEDLEAVPLPDYDRKLRVRAPESWHAVYAYTWDPEKLGAWPGTQLIKRESGIYELTIPDTMVNLVLSDMLEGSALQTTEDLKLECNGKDILVIIDEYGVAYVSYDDPEIDIELPQSLALVGSGLPGISEWNPADPAGDMTRVSDTVFVKTLELSAGTCLNFKIAGNDMWDDRWNFGGTQIQLNQELPLRCGGDSTDMTYTVTTDCTLRFTIDLSGMLDGGRATLLVERRDHPVKNRKLTVYAPNNWMTVDAFTWEPEELGGWPGTAMTKQGDAYEMQIPETMVHLVISGSKSDGTRMQSGDIYLETNGKDVKVVIHEDGSHTVSYRAGITQYRVVGNAPWMGNWDPASDAGLMSEVAREMYQKTFVDVQPGSYEFKITKDGKWEDAIGNWDGSNFCFTVNTACDVTVVYTPVNEKVDIFVGNVSALKGDVTDDGKLNLGDVAKLYGFIRGSLELPDATIRNNADFTDDGNLNIGDVAGLYAYIRGTDKRAIVDAAYRLEENQEMEMDYTLTGYVTEVVSAYNFDTQCITVLMAVEGRQEYPILCTRLTGSANTELITVGDIITVTGRIRNFYGVVEFKEGCQLTNWLDCETVEEYMARIVDEAYALGHNETMNGSATLRGYVIAVEQPYTSGVPYISVTIVVPGKEDKPISCYRLMGDGIEYISSGDLITVTGTLRNYHGTVEFNEGCRLVK